jgi:hypothetical protein
VAGCSKKVSPYEQPYDRVDSAPVGAPPGVGRTSAPFHRGFRGIPWFSRVKIVSQSPRDRLHPRLRQWLVDSSGTKRVQVVIGFRGRIPFPRLPIEALEKDTLWAPNAAVAARIDALVDSVRMLRAPFYSAETSMLANAHGAQILETYTLTQAVVAEIALGELLAIASRTDVLSIQPASSGDAPPACANPAGATVAQAQQEMRTAPFVSPGYGRGTIGMLDTGVYASHSMLQPLAQGTPQQLQLFDCTDPTQDCGGPDKGDLDYALNGHGTRTASILAGTDVLGAEHKGVTTSKVQSYQAYTPVAAYPGTSTLDDQAFPRTMLEAARHNSVILAEVQSKTGPDGTVSNAANDAFAAGVVVVAAVGDGGTSWIGAPGSAAWVMGIGAYELTTGKPTYSNESRGYALERTKPDVQAPTTTLAASTNGPDCLGLHAATSGAAPYAAAVALLLRNWMGASNPTPPAHPIDPGQVYAAMIACGTASRASGTARYPVSRGAGRIQLPALGRAWWGKTDVGLFGPANIPFTIPAGTGYKKFHAAIWWPDPPTPTRLGPHSVLVSHLEYTLKASVGSSGLVKSSGGPNAPFESVHLSASSPVSGACTLTITANAPGFAQVPVYWFFVATP